MGPRKRPRLQYCVSSVYTRIDGTRPSVYTLVDGTRPSVLTVMYTMGMLCVLV